MGYRLARRESSPSASTPTPRLTDSIALQRRATSADRRCGQTLQRCPTPMPDRASDYRPGCNARAQYRRRRFDPPRSRTPMGSNVQMLGSDRAAAGRPASRSTSPTACSRARRRRASCVAQFPATMGSSNIRCRSARGRSTTYAFNPPCQYHPSCSGNADKADPKLKFPPGPNNPVGVVWLDLTKEHYGIHGTPEPPDHRPRRNPMAASA